MSKKSNNKSKSPDERTVAVPEAEVQEASSPDAAETPKASTEAAETQDAPESVETPPDGEAEAAALREALSSEQDKYLRLAAEYDNFRRRSQKERESIYLNAKADVVTALLPVYDNLERALSQSTADEAFYKGVALTMAQLKEIFQSLGVLEITALGQTFDPALHNAVLHIEDATFGENEIVEELQKGFQLGDKVIRFSMVKVAN